MMKIKVLYAQSAAAAYLLFWVSADGQVDIFMGDFPTEDAARGAIDDALAELLSNANEGHADILRGSWTIEEVGGDRV